MSDLHTEELSISSRAMLVSFSVSFWEARTKDQEITREISQNHGSDPDMLTAWKRLVSKDQPAFRDLVKARNAVRALHYANTLPWTDGSWRLLPTANYMAYTEKMRAALADFDQKADAFVAVFWDVREEARAKLNGAFRAGDYPAPHALRAKYHHSIDFAPLPAQGDFRIDLPGQELAALETQVQDRVTRATRAAMADAWQRLTDVVSNMKDRLSEPGAIFRDSLVGNVRELADVLQRLNVTGDAALEAMRQRVELELCGIDAQTLRDNPDTRQDTARKADAILAAMAGIYGQGASHV